MTVDGPTTEAGRILDRGAVVAGWVGLGMALVIAISFELIIAVQPLVLLAAPLAGALIGAYANQRSERWRPRGRVLLNATYAGLVTGVGLALIYVGLRLLFVYADSGYRPEDLGGQLACSTGPECTYMRWIEEGRRDQLAAEGIVDSDSFEAWILQAQLTGALLITSLTAGGAVLAGGVRAARQPPSPDGGLPVPTAVPRVGLSQESDREGEHHTSRAPAPAAPQEGDP